ncbi:RNA helicase [Sarracenia purpurea var. burkii]
MVEQSELKFTAFPFKPYSIQIDFMNSLYRSLDRGGISMLESPTGTGKTLSIICSALQWLVDRKHSQNSEATADSNHNPNSGSDDEPDWMKNFVANKEIQIEEKKAIKKKKNKQGLRSMKLDKKRNHEVFGGLFNHKGEFGNVCEEKEKKNLIQRSDTEELNDQEFLVEEYESEEESDAGCGQSKRKADGVSIGSSSDDEEQDDGFDDEDDGEAALQIYFCSRTHSQLSQFIKELRKTVFGSQLKVICLGSRKNFCINEGNSTRINERCLELQKNKKDDFSKMKNLGAGGRIRRIKGSCGCPMLQKYKLQKQFRSEIYQEGAFDIEDLVRLGSRIGTCPYYGSRSMVHSADLVVLPYQSLLSKSSRESLGLNLKNNIIIIDEAHNLADSLISMYDSKITLPEVSGYGDKAARLCNGSTLGDESSEEGSSLSGFQAFANMLLSLTNKDGDGRIIISRRPTCFGQEGGYLKYVMLTGEKIFHEIVDQTHAIVLAGGTLQPIEETRERLFPWLKPDQLHFFSCNHIVPPESILPVAISNGPSGRSFDFSYSSRSSPIMVTIEELGLLLCNLVAVVPEGIIVFFSSFDYEGQVYDAWKASGILARISKKKHVFREPRRNADVELVLKEYKTIIDASSGGDLKADPAPHNGAILLAVVGGKISEGINFSDGMGRCIVMVGLPYPSPSDIELIERVKHIDGLGDISLSKTAEVYESYSGDVKAGFGILRSCKRRGKEYYENLCMKAVNQSIGRAIRHINDYAAILLVDARYAADSSKRSFSHPTNKFPQWIKDRLVSKTDNYGEVHRLLNQFFKYNKKKGVERRVPLECRQTGRPAVICWPHIWEFLDIGLDWNSSKKIAAAWIK